MSCQRRLGPHQNVDSKNAESYEKKQNVRCFDRLWDFDGLRL